MTRFKWLIVALVANIVLILLFLIGDRGAFRSEKAVAGDHWPAEASRPFRPGKPLHILISGTSLTARGSWTKELEALLTPCRPEGVTVEKLALSGANSEWGQATLTERRQNGPTPDIIIMEFTGNDARLYRGVSLAKTDARMRQLIADARQQGALPYLSTMSVVTGREHWERPWLSAYHDLYREIAISTQSGLIDSAPAWAQLDVSQLQMLMPDGSHFTPEAARKMILPAYVANLSPLVCTKG